MTSVELFKTTNCVFNDNSDSFRFIHLILYLFGLLLLAIIYEIIIIFNNLNEQRSYMIKANGEIQNKLKQIELIEKSIQKLNNQSENESKINQFEKQINIYKLQIQNLNKQNDKLIQNDSILFDKTKKQETKFKEVENMVKPAYNYVNCNETILIGFNIQNNYLTPFYISKNITYLSQNYLPSSEHHSFVLLKMLKTTSINKIDLYSVIHFGYKYNYDDSRTRYDCHITGMVNDIFKIREIQKLYNFIQDMGIEIELPEGHKEILFSIN